MPQVDRAARSATGRVGVRPFTRHLLGGAGAVVILCLLGVAANLADTGMYPRLGLPVAALSIQVLVAALRVFVTLAAAVALGSLVFAAFLAPAQPSGTVDVDGYRALRRGGWSAAAAAAGGLVLAVASAADLSGASPAAVLVGGDVLGTFALLEEPMGWFLLGVGFCLVALGCVWVLSRRSSGLLAGLAAVSVLPPATVGQATVGRGHDWATDAGVFQALGLALWLGVLVALIAHHTRHGTHSSAEWRRGRIVLACAGLAWAGSTLVLALLLVPPAGLTDSAWGRWQLVEAALFAVAAALWLCCGRRGRFLVPLAVVSGVVVVVGGAMAHAVPPRFLVRGDTEGEVLVGYDLPEPFTALRALLDWRINVLFTLGAVVAVGAYLYGVRVLRARGDLWSPGRTAAWVCGWVVVELSTSSGIGRYAPGMFSIHMISHMTLNMLGPVLLALGGPITLALRALRPAGRGRPSGPREWVAELLELPGMRLLTHPLVTPVLFVGSFYVLYFTPLFEGALRYHWAHQLMNIHFLAVGYLFFWPLIGVDRAPVRLPHLGRLAVLLATMPFHAFFGIALMSTNTLIGGEFYRSLALPWLPDLLADQRVGGGIAWAAGEIPILLVVIALLTQWAREDERAARRHSRREELDDDAELRAYNDMLARLAQSRR